MAIVENAPRSCREQYLEAVAPHLRQPKRLAQDNKLARRLLHWTDHR